MSGTAPHLGHHYGPAPTSAELGITMANAKREWFIFREFGIKRSELLGYATEALAKAAYDRYMASPYTVSCTLIHGNVVKEAQAHV